MYLKLVYQKKKKRIYPQFKTTVKEKKSKLREQISRELLGWTPCHMSSDPSKILSVTLREDTHHCLKENTALGSKWQNLVNKVTHKGWIAWTYFCWERQGYKLTRMILSQWLRQPRDSKVALCGKMTVNQSLSEFPPLSPVFPLLVIMALPFLISPASNLRQENSYFSSDAQGDGILPEPGTTTAR